MNDIAPFSQRIDRLDVGLFEKIDTQTSHKERRSLLALQRCIRKQFSSYIYLEIGSHLGGSIQPYFVDEQCQLIYSIDKRPLAQPDERGGLYEYHNNSTQRMLDLLEENYPSGSLKKLVTFDTGTDEVDPQVIEPRPNICFIDGEHTNQAVYQDFKFCQQVATSDAVLVFHDANFVFKGLQRIEAELAQNGTAYRAYVLGGSVYVILLGQSIDWFGEQLAAFSKDKARFFQRSAKSLKKLRLQRRYPALYQIYDKNKHQPMIKSLKRTAKKVLVKMGLKQPARHYMEISEGHLGGYIIDKPAPGTWCPEIWDWCVKDLGVESMLDVGCGMGFVMEYFAQSGVASFGVDGSPSAIEKNVMDAALLKKHDFTLGPWQPERAYDLVWSSEFLEHVEQQYEPNFFVTFQAARKYLMVTFAVPGQGGHHHVNEQYGEYWIKRFAEIGFAYDDELTQKARQLLPQQGMKGMQFRDKGLVFKRV
ncbi:MAG: methyltransferase domain-containing protein [Bacteroidota bacterium]